MLVFFFSFTSSSSSSSSSSSKVISRHSDTLSLQNVKVSYKSFTVTILVIKVCVTLIKRLSKYSLMGFYNIVYVAIIMVVFVVVVVVVVVVRNASFFSKPIFTCTIRHLDYTFYLTFYLLPSTCYLSSPLKFP